MDNIYSREQWQEKQQWIETIVRKSQADIIGFQEVFSPSALASQCQKLGLNHFVCLQQPQLELDYIYSKPPVALASRFPILEAGTVDVDLTLLNDLNISPDFVFSRKIIRASILVPRLGECLIYVLHLKSKRPSLETDYVIKRQKLTRSEIQQRVEQDVLAYVHGSWGSTIQRGTEAALLYQDIRQQMAASSKPRPVIVMGDFNDSLDSDALSPMVNSQKVRRVNGQMADRLCYTSQKALNHTTLYDVRELCPEIKDHKTQPTHYHGAEGNVIDHLLLSNDFDVRDVQSLASVVDYQVFDQHLIDPVFVNDSQCSDHALVCASIQPRV